MTHGFDDQGRKFDTQGNLRDWWTTEDSKAFESRAACFADQYSAYTVAGDTKVNGRLTLGENTGDNGGLRLALMAYLAGPGLTAAPLIDGFTPQQRVFLGWAQAWCENARPEAERLKAATNPHASNRYRVNGPLSNMPEFQQAFSCKADAPMVRPERMPRVVDQADIETTTAAHAVTQRLQLRCRAALSGPPDRGPERRTLRVL